MAQPRSGGNGDSTVPEDATDEPHTLAGEEEDERGARRAEQQERSPHPVWPQADDPMRQGGESSPAPDKRRR